MLLRGLTAAMLLAIVPVLVRLLQSDLRKPRILLSVFLLVQVVEGTVSLFFGPSTAPAFWLYVVGGPFRWVLYVALISEIYAAVFSHYPGIRTAVKSSLFTALFLASLFSGIVAWSTWREHASTAGHLYYFELAERTVMLTLLLFVILLFVLVSKYPLEAHHNLLVSSLGFCAFFLVQSLLLLFEWVHPLAATDVMNEVMAGFAVSCYVTWAVALRTGASVPIMRPAPARASEEEDLLRQLSVINTTLLRAFGR